MGDAAAAMLSSGGRGQRRDAVFSVSWHRQYEAFIFFFPPRSVVWAAPCEAMRWGCLRSVLGILSGIP